MRTKLEIDTAFASRDQLAGRRSFFLVGIGGAGMSGIACMLLGRGFKVRGVDCTASPVVEGLRSLGIDVWIGSAADQISAEDAVVLTDAIDLQTNKEVATAHALGCPMFRRSQVLGWLLKDHRLIAVTGTHGKTTTTAMLGSALISAGLDPLIVVGAEVPQFGSAVVEGKGSVAVVEACEAYDSFHDLDPEIVVLTNLEPDHLDFHETWENLRGSVARFVAKADTLVYAREDPGAAEVASGFGGCAIGYQAVESDLASPGQHNRLNAAGAFEAAKLAGADPELAMRGIAGFSGAHRRLQVLQEGPITVVDDYAHHPTEIVASLSALRERYPGRRLVVVFQPHLYSRTRDFMDEFAPALSLADLVVLTDIYPAREVPLAGISSARIVEQIAKPVFYVPSRHLLPRYVKDLIEDQDVVVGMGAGNIEDFAPKLVLELNRSGGPNIVVVAGGDSTEREVSLHSGIAIEAALRRRNYQVQRVDVSELLLTGAVVPNADLAFFAVHGTHAEDGAIQGYFELLHIPYTGSGIQSSAIAMDKNLTKRLVAAEGIRVPQGMVLRSVVEAAEWTSFPAVVKPNAQGSTVGLSFVETREELVKAVDTALRFGSEVLVEELIVGVEISVPVHLGKTLPAVEIVPTSGRYDFASKYIPGATEEICPARLSESILEQAADIALRAHNILRCQGPTRTDMIVRGEEIFFLEINTLPGMTPTSLLPNSAKTAGIEFDELCVQIVEEALTVYATR